MLFSISTLCVLFFQVATKLFKCKYFLSFWTSLLSKKNYSEFFLLICFLACSQLWGLEKEMATHSSVLAWRIPGVAQSRTQLKRLSSSFGDHGKVMGTFRVLELKKYGNVWRGPQTHKEGMSGILGAELLKT